MARMSRTWPAPVSFTPATRRPWALRRRTTDFAALVLPQLHRGADDQHDRSVECCAGHTRREVDQAELAVAPGVAAVDHSSFGILGAWARGRDGRRGGDGGRGLRR